jgi:low affinity Fe/Cu permease
MGEHFRKFAGKASKLAGSSWAFLVAVALIVVWAVSGPFLHFSDVWQLTINTGTTIITFLMVFVIQNTQNRDSEAVHLKLDELLRANKAAHTNMVDLEDLSDDDLQHLQDTFRQLREEEGNPLADHANDLAGTIDTTPQGHDAKQAGRDRGQHAPDVGP